jgi:ferredoxin
MTTPEQRAQQTAYMREWRKRNPERVKATNLRYREARREEMAAKTRRYKERKPWCDIRTNFPGRETEEYEYWHEERQGPCDICGERCPTGKLLAIDHDHETGQIRGVLCNRCNRGLGYFKDDPERLLAAIGYLGMALGERA